MTDRSFTPPTHPLTGAGILFTLLGMVTMAYGLLSSGAPGNSQTLNLGLLNDKLILAIAGSSIFLGGLFLAVMGAVLNHLAQVSRIGRGAPPPQSGPAVLPERPEVSRPIMDPPPPAEAAPAAPPQPGDNIRPGAL